MFWENNGLDFIINGFDTAKVAIDVARGGGALEALHVDPIFSYVNFRQQKRVKIRVGLQTYPLFTTCLSSFSLDACFS